VDTLPEYQLIITTSAGDLTVLLYAEESPLTVDNFLAYVNSGFYDGQDNLGATTFHRVINDFMIQGGGFSVDGIQKETLSPIINEANNGLTNTRGTLAMARTNAPNSATSQFFINQLDNAHLDYGGASSPGYAVFGEVLNGMDVVDTIAAVDTSASDEPLEDIVIEDILTWVEDAEASNP
jgi:cyclophilin family peptidyl-prolyl cis-trans isomerase